jgi:hypothetical protein
LQDLERAAEWSDAGTPGDGWNLHEEGNSPICRRVPLEVEGIAINEFARVGPCEVITVERSRSTELLQGDARASGRV